MFTSITALLECIKQFLTNRDTEMKNKPTLEVVRDKRQLKKASNTTEKLFFITDKYVDLFDEKDKKRYTSLKKKFFKNN